jgi:hypothetical protein
VQLDLEFCGVGGGNFECGLTPIKLVTIDCRWTPPPLSLLRIKRRYTTR